VVKEKITDLALFGGSVLFKEPRPTGQLYLPDEAVFFNYLDEIYHTKRLTNNGQLVRLLEQRLAHYHQTKHCIAVANAGLGIILVLKHYANTKQGNVILPSFTYPGLKHIVRWADQIPNYCDIDYHTHTLDPKQVESRIQENTSAILAVHQVNSPCYINELQEIASSADIPLIFDSVHGIGCSYHGVPVGGFGAAEIFSLHATKVLNGFEGGYITTNNDDLANSLCSMRNFGFQGRDQVTTLGLNAKLNEIHAAMALASLAEINHVIHSNKLRYDEYCHLFRKIPELSMLPYNNNEENNYELPIL
jgi:dTDP-4-amino-4,6-dideoxygalactose transaminase